MNSSWRVQVVNQGPRLLSTARDEMGDANQAHLFVHTVISEALGKVPGPASLEAMDTRMSALVRNQVKLDEAAPG